MQWPYTYDSCDVGTVANQTLNGLPLAATVNGDQSQNGVLSFLPGQRLSRCTCPGESHPGPIHADGTYVGRSAPEIDVFEAQISVPVSAPDGSTSLGGEVSQSAQWAVCLRVMWRVISSLNLYFSLSTQVISGTTIQITSSFTTRRYLS